MMWTHASSVPLPIAELICERVPRLAHSIFYDVQSESFYDEIVDDDSGGGDGKLVKKWV